MTYSSFLEEDGFVIFLFRGVIKSHRYEVRNYTRKHILRDDFVHILDELCSNGMPVSMASIANGDPLLRRVDAKQRMIQGRVDS